jgi:hypothetical protein
MSKKRRTWIWVLFITLLVFAGSVWVYKNKSRIYFETLEAFNPGGPEEVLKNYGDDIMLMADSFDISPYYLKALCMLECSGRKYIKPRFESHVFEKLKQVKYGQLDKFEHVEQHMLTDASDEALKNLASSWGPFQLMGYKCLLLDIKIADIRGDNAIYWGIKWIDLTYGDLLRKGKYKDSFHIHNTGKPYPKSGKSRTHNPEYVTNGLKWMEFFKNNS